MLARAKGDPYKANAELIEGGRSGFSALLCGYRDPKGPFHSLGSSGYYWSATDKRSVYAWVYIFSRDGDKLVRNYRYKASGFPCSCVQD